MVEYLHKSSCFKVPKFSPLRSGMIGWSNVLEYAKVGSVVAYCANDGHGNYRHGDTGFVHYVDPRGEYVIVVVDTPIESWFVLLQPLYDCIAPTAQELVDSMKKVMETS